MMAIMFLPRQFQVAVIENLDEKHLNKAIWLFPLYMLAINVFVLPIAFGGLLRFPDGSVDADTFVLTLPMAEKHELLALLVFIGGLSAATGMVIVETIALSTMVCNDLVMPVLLRIRRLRLNERVDLTGLLLGIRRGAIVLHPAAWLPLFQAGRRGLRAGLDRPDLVRRGGAVRAGDVRRDILERRHPHRSAVRAARRASSSGSTRCSCRRWRVPAGCPSASSMTARSGSHCSSRCSCSGSRGSIEISHAMIWSMIANVGAYVIASLSVSPSADEHRQASLFVDVFRHSWRGTGRAFLARHGVGARPV